eukprot:1782367-Amphidinium_carterae.1
MEVSLASQVNQVAWDDYIRAGTTNLEPTRCCERLQQGNSDTPPASIVTTVLVSYWTIKRCLMFLKSSHQGATSFAPSICAPSFRRQSHKLDIERHLSGFSPECFRALCKSRRALCKCIFDAITHAQTLSMARLSQSDNTKSHALMALMRATVTNKTSLAPNVLRHLWPQAIYNRLLASLTLGY